ncbi:hypothetical protein CH380_10820 [Leptospira adleri]|uniref:Uncharacterized protein n=1 Tax=Leptospira adleri TaxID=2023186 RepID=A0A2M9YP78_9LEPT|nr:hypothetical protein CH380_10820 [Leptospira adleri]PJZ63902.1 hypothetical protein CH376_00290 [Leptospira adleri]
MSSYFFIEESKDKSMKETQEFPHLSILCEIFLIVFSETGMLTLLPNPLPKCKSESYRRFEIFSDRFSKFRSFE